MYKKVELKQDGFVGMEREVAKTWKEKNVIQKNFDLNKGKRYFTFYDGPPTANGMPHAGHIITRVMKDIIPRYKVMKGYRVIRKAGWDTHGLPVELEIEKKLGISGKEQIEEYEKENNEHPELRAAHKALAREIITFLHGKEEYEKAVNLADHLFNNKFNDLSKSDIEELFGSEDIKEVTPNQTIVDMLVEMKAVSSKREAKEFVTNGAISVNGEKINDISEIIDESKFIENTYIVVKRGKKNYYIGKKK